MLRTVGDWLEDIEFAIPAALAGLVLAVGSLVLVVRLLRTGHPAAGAIAFALWFSVLVVCIRGLRQRRFGGVSKAFGVVWLVMTLAFWWWIETS